MVAKRVAGDEAGARKCKSKAGKIPVLNCAVVPQQLSPRDGKPLSTSCRTPYSDEAIVDEGYLNCFDVVDTMCNGRFSQLDAPSTAYDDESLSETAASAATTPTAMNATIHPLSGCSPPSPPPSISSKDDDEKRVCFMHPQTGQMLTGNRAPRRAETIRKYLAEGWVPMNRERRARARMKSLSSKPAGQPSSSSFDGCRAAEVVRLTDHECSIRWIGAAHSRGTKKYYTRVRVNGSEYAIGDCCYLATEGAATRIVKFTVLWENGATGEQGLDAVCFIRNTDATGSVTAHTSDCKEVHASSETISGPLRAIEGRCFVFPLSQVTDWPALYSDPHAYYCKYGDDQHVQIQGINDTTYASFDMLDVAENQMQLSASDDGEDSTDEFCSIDIKSIGYDELPPIAADVEALSCSL